MQLQDIEKELLKVYIDAVARFRWFLLTTTILSGLMLAHLYLEHSFSNLELQQRVTAQVLDDIPQEMEERKHQINAWRKSVQLLQFQKDALTEAEAQKSSPKERAYYLGLGDKYGKRAEELRAGIRIDSDAKFEKEVHFYAEQVFHQTQYDNEMKSLRLTDRTIPLLGLNVPGNDFIPLLSCLLLLLLVFMLVTTCSVRAPVESLLLVDKEIADSGREAGDLNPALKGSEQPEAKGAEDKQELKNLLRLQFVFIGNMNPEGSDRFARFQRGVVPFIPVTLATIAIIISEIFLRTNIVRQEMLPEEKFIFSVRTGILGAILVVQWLLSWRIFFNLGKVQEQFGASSVKKNTNVAAARPAPTSAS